MKIPWSLRWRLWASYLYECVIEATQSEYNPELYVTLRNGRFILHTPKAIYSYEDKYSNFAKAIQHIGPEQFEGRHVLLLGLGLASIPMIFEKKHQLILDYTAVEIDPVVISLCQKYASPLLDSNMQIYQAHAKAFVDQTSEVYGAIMMDVFLDDVIPDMLQDHVFLQQLEGILAPGGFLLYNLLYSTEQDRKQADAFYDQAFRPCFPNAQKLVVDKNLIIYHHNT